MYSVTKKLGGQTKTKRKGNYPSCTMTSFNDLKTVTQAGLAWMPARELTMPATPYPHLFSPAVLCAIVSVYLRQLPRYRRSSS
ncbi:uncharacterized protein METZ01_LOCUS348121, partial [marine metagenome]